MSSGIQTVYINGTTIGTVTYTGSYVPPANDVVIGNGNSDYCQPFNGMIDSFRIYSNGLSSGEILQLYKTNNDTMPKPPAVWLSYKFDEASGAVAVDSSGQGHNGTLISGGTRTFGPAGLCRAVSFNGVNQYVDTGTKLTNLQVPFSLSFWTMPDAAQKGSAGILGNHFNYQGFVVQMDGTANSLKFYFYMGVGSAWRSSAAFTLTADIWQHVAIVVESTAQGNSGLSTAGQIKVYVNGNLASSTAYTGTYCYLTSGNLFVGNGHTLTDPRFYSGAVDEVKIASGALSASEVASLAQMGDMWVHYEFNEASGNTTEDLSGSCHTGQFKNGATRATGLSGYGNALSLAAASKQYVDTGTNFPFMKGAFTIALWVKPSTTNGVHAGIAGMHDDTFQGWALQMDGTANSNKYYFVFGNGAAWIPDTPVLRRGFNNNSHVLPDVRRHCERCRNLRSARA